MVRKPPSKIPEKAAGLSALLLEKSRDRRQQILRDKNRTIFRIHESGYPTKDLKNAFMMCEGWSEFHTGIKAYLLGVDLRKG